MFLYQPGIVLVLYTLGLVAVFSSFFMRAPDVSIGIPRKLWLPIWKQKPLFSSAGWKVYLVGWVLILGAVSTKLAIRYFLGG